MKNNKPIVFIDLDDTIVLYKEAWKLHKRQYPEIEYPQSVEGFFLKLKPIKGAKEVIESLYKNFDVWFLTRPSYLNPLSYTEKRLWIEKHYGLEMCEKLIFSPDKSLLIGSYLIDDIIWKNFMGIQIQFGSDNFKNWKQVKNELYELEFNGKINL